MGVARAQPFLVDEPNGLAFASADTAYPNLKQRLGIDALPPGAMRDAAMRIACELACSLPNAPLAAACDEAIDNRDRNLGNILWDGQSDAWIDHAFALGQGMHLYDVNKLCGMAVGVGHQERMSRGAVAQALLISRDAPNEIETELSERLGSTGFAALVAARISSLGNRLLARFPKVDDLLAGA